MSNQGIQTQRSVSAALDRALGRALKQEAEEGAQTLDIQSAKLIILSDQHKGNRDGADDFLRCERAYDAALDYYDRLGYTLVVLGDVEELWEEPAKNVLKAYPQILTQEGKFHREGRYLRFWGNHDDAWSHADLVDGLLAPALGAGPIKVREALMLHVRDGEAVLGRFLLLHGHQGTYDSDFLSPLSKLFVRLIWRPIQRFLNVGFNTPAKDYQLRSAHDSAMYLWSEAQPKLVLVAGHTHRPVFRSEPSEAVMFNLVADSEQKLASNPGNSKLARETAELGTELELLMAQNQRSAMAEAAVEFKKPSYFNSGCCAFQNGDITGLEISDGEIRLVLWADGDDLTGPKVLLSARLTEVFAAC
jgi:UDP-2,3-diacylglucosamine pyrophosphatase LpxH